MVCAVSGGTEGADVSPHRRFLTALSAQHMLCCPCTLCAAGRVDDDDALEMSVITVRLRVGHLSRAWQHV